MKYYSKKVKMIEEETTDLEYIRCDGCHEKIKEKERFWRVTTSHHSWGNDSVDSIENYDICNKCIADFSKHYFDNATYNTEDFEAESDMYVKHDKSYRNSYGMFDFDNKFVEEDNYLERR